eukprot:Colp12_sorted_trinity150504_noHs@537
MLVLKKLVGQHSVNAFLSGCLGGYLVFGESSNINQQINMYLLSRIMFGLVKVAAQKGFIPTPEADPFPLFGTLVWGIVLWLFEHEKWSLQPSLQNSMTYLYHDSNVFNSIRNWLIYNK